MPEDFDDFDDADEDADLSPLCRAAALVQAGLELLDGVEFIDNGAIEDGELTVIPAAGPVFRVRIEIFQEHV